MKYSNVFLVAGVASIPFMFTTTDVHSQNEWSDLTFLKRDEAAQKFAKRKLQRYNDLERNLKECDFESNTTHLSPDINSDILSYGLHSFLEAKKEKWKKRSELSGTAAQEEREKSMTRSILYKRKPQTNSEWEQLLTQAEKGYHVLSIQYRARKELENVISKVREKLKPENTLDHELLGTYASILGSAVNILKIMNIDNEITRYRKLHFALIDKQKELMGFIPEVSLLNTISYSIMAIIDVEFKKTLISDKNNRWGYDFQPTASPWKKEDPVFKACEWGHGDIMIGLSKIFSPHSDCRSFYYSADLAHQNPFCEETINFYADSTKINCPVVFNCSFLPSGCHYYLQKTGGEISFEPPTAERRKMSEENFNLWKKKVTQTLNHKNWDGYLDEEQIEHLKKEEAQNTRSAESPLLVKKLVAGPNGDKTHLIVASPHNDPGPLVRKGFHAGWIKLLDKKVTQGHALVALNYNFSEKALAEGSHSAGEYKDMALVVPAAYVTVCEEGVNALPYFGLGGHSCATAILSSITSHIRAYYPNLTHLEIKHAILEGANRTFEGYNEELHGRGMLNIKGALDIAETLKENRRP